MSSHRTRAGERTTELILSVFRANGLLLTAGDELAAAEELTAARWQVLGAIALAGRSLTVPQIARRMGLTRQSVHATVRRLHQDRLVSLMPNPDHRRSQLVRLTDLGTERYRAMEHKQAVWVDELATGLPPADLATAVRVLDELCNRLDADRGVET